VRPFPLTFAALAAVYLALRWRRSSTERRVLLILAVVGFGVYGSGLVHPPSAEHVISDLGRRLGRWTYLLVGVMAFLETGAFIGLIAPGETVVVLGGVVAGQGRIDVVVLIGLVWAAAVAGDCASYALGRRLGRDFMVRHGGRLKITEQRLEHVESFYGRHGGKAILLGRFVGLVRAIQPFLAGASRLALRRFLPYDIIGAGLWGTAFVLLGYFSWQSFNQAVKLAKQGTLAVATIIVVVGGGIAAYRYLRVPENRRRAAAWLEEQFDRPGLRPVARALRPVYRRVLRPAWNAVAGPLRFFWQRITPGELGLELTTLLAVALVGGFVFGAIASQLHARTAALPMDVEALRLADRLRTGVAVDVAKVVTALGSLAVVAPVVAVTSVWLAIRQRIAEGSALVAGLALTVVAVHVAKVASDRPRPLQPLVDTMGMAYPSGHAAYSVAYVAVAVVLVRVRGVVGRVSAVTIALVLAAAIGASRVYLRAHYLSDVIGGWALGAAIFALCGMLALVISFVRHNSPAP
jgi:undecaprenyl-diphosphatase